MKNAAIECALPECPDEKQRALSNDIKVWNKLAVSKGWIRRKWHVISLRIIPVEHLIEGPANFKYNIGKIKDQYLAACAKFPEETHDQIESKYMSATSESDRVNALYRNTKVKLIQLEHRLEKERGNLDKLKHRRKEVAAKLEILGADC